MPRHNCSDLERFFKNVDRSQLLFPHYLPEYGPFFWKGKTKGGFPFNPTKNTFKAEHHVYKPDLRHVQDYFPIFIVDGHRHSAFRWLYFQMYDDRDNPYAGVRLRKQEEYAESLGRRYVRPMPNRLRIKRLPLCTHQTKHAMQVFTHHPIAMQRLSEDAPDMLRPWNMLFWWDNTKHKNTLYDTLHHFKKYDRPGRGAKSQEEYDKAIRAAEEDVEVARFGPSEHHEFLMWRYGFNDWVSYGMSLTKTIYKPDADYHPVELVFPEYVGAERIELVRHYMRGGKDHDRPEPKGIKPDKQAMKQILKEYPL